MIPTFFKKLLITNLVTALTLAQPPANQTIQPITQNAIQLTTQPAVSKKALIKEHIHEFLKDYISQSIEGSPNCSPNKRFRELEKTYGLEGLVSRYEESHFQCLALAEDSSTKQHQITEEQYFDLGKFLCAMQKKMSSPQVDYNAPSVIQAQTHWAQIRTQHFIRLLQVQEPVTGFPELVREAYTKEQFQIYVAQQNEASIRLYDSAYGTLSGFLRFVGAGKDEIKTLKYFTLRVYDNMIQEFFPENKRDKNNGRH